jgi:hypothetical protein
MEINVNGILTTASALILIRFAEHLFPQHLTRGEVLMAAKALKKCWDGISSDILLLALPMLMNYLLILFIMCLIHGKFRNRWKQVRVSIIRTPGKSDYFD